MKRPRLPWRTNPMLEINCPYCGRRPELEFSYGGQAHLVRPVQPQDWSESQWGDFLYTRSNVRGVHAERWRHTNGCGRFFNALRDTRTDRFLAFYKTGEPQPQLPGDAP